MNILANNFTYDNKYTQNPHPDVSSAPKKSHVQF